MTVKELKALLEDYEENMPVFVSIFYKDNTAEVAEITAAGHNRGLQLNVMSHRRVK